MAVLAVLAFAAGVFVASGSPERDAAERFTSAWEAGDYEAMHAELTADAAASYPVEEFTNAYERAAATATATAVEIESLDGPQSEDGSEVVTATAAATTTVFGEVPGEVAIPVADGAIAWEPHLVFPGLLPGEKLERRTVAPKRAPILARDGTALAEGPSSARSLPLSAGADVTGAIGTPKREQAEALEAAGFPAGTLVGETGLEQAFNERLMGTPGGELLAVGEGEPRVLAESEPVKAEPLKTTIDPTLQSAAVDELGGLFGGVAVLDATSGEVRALAGLAYSSPQPPGSTFKIITTVAALEDDLVKLTDEFPVVSSTIVGGRSVSNAGGELCGGTFVESFAHSCNTVFGPLGEEVGGKRLVEESEEFGFNQPPALFDEEATEIVNPPESVIPEDLPEAEVGVSAIGQGMVLASPLELASISQTIASGGLRQPTPMVTEPELQPDAQPVRVTNEEIASTVRDLMIQVVENGTGESAALPDIQVAGKTGTAETGIEGADHAWFTAFAPAGNPKLAVAVMIVNAGAPGGTVAAPIARDVLAAGLYN